MDALAAATLAGVLAAATIWWTWGDVARDRARAAAALGLATGERRAGGSPLAELLVRAGRSAPGDLLDALGGRPSAAARLPQAEAVRTVHLARGFASLLALAGFAVAAATGNALWLASIVLAPVFARWTVDRWLAARAAERARVLEREVTSALDVFVLALDAGLPFERAMTAYTQSLDGPLAEELRTATGDLDVGYRRREALDRTVVRTGSLGLAQLAATVRLAEDFGTPLAGAIRGLATDLRATRRQRLQEAALRAPVTMLLPTAGFILVPIFAIVLGPVVLRVLGGSLF
jgi:Flp pilus assembly protein TadB